MKIRSYLIALVVALSSTNALAQCVTGVETDILTHWSTATNSFSFGATGQWPGVLPGAMSPDGSSPSYTYGSAFLPDYQNYITSSYSSRRVPQATAAAWATQFSAELGGLPFRIYNPYDPSLGDINTRIAVGQPCVQIVPGLLISGSLATLVLPPYWTPAAVTPYPVMVASQYDVNEGMFGGNPSAPAAARSPAQLLTRWIGESGILGRTGAVGIVWNGGASLTSLTSNTLARQQFADVISFAETYARADRNRIIMFGGSRGGLATLMMASNPEARPYRITFAVVSNPGTRLGTSTKLIGSTLAAQMSNLLPQLGFANSWLPGWLYPAFGKPSMSGMTADAALRYLIAGTTNVSDVDVYHSPIGPNFVNGLFNAQTEVVMGIGSHDEFVPYGTEVEYLHALRARGVPVEAHIILRGGHTPLPGLYDRAFSALLSYVTIGATDAARRVATGAASIRYYAVNRSTGQPDLLPLLDATSRRPFTFEIPRVMYGGMPITMMVAGEPGTQYWIYNNGISTVTGTLPASGWDTLTAPTSPGFGWLWYDVYFLPPPYTTLIHLDMYSPPSSNPAAGWTYITTAPPNINGNSLWNRLKSGLCTDPNPPLPEFAAVPCWQPAGAFSQVNWGMSEY